MLIRGSSKMTVNIFLCLLIYNELQESLGCGLSLDTQTSFEDVGLDSDEHFLRTDHEKNWL